MATSDLAAPQQTSTTGRYQPITSSLGKSFFCSFCLFKIQAQWTVIKKW
jgi:hypothetical protein